MSITLPGSQNRTAIVGSTGSGKTQFAVWLLSTRDFHLRPWVIIDFKRDKLIADIGAQEISIRGRPPIEPGLYIARPLPNIDDEFVTRFLFLCWEQENIGIYIDEGYMVKLRNPALTACLTQGRSKRIEMMILCQRPVWVDKFVFSEASYFVLFNLTVKDDRKHISNFVPDVQFGLLPKYHSLYYDVEAQRAVTFSPVPSREVILSRFKERLGERVKRL
jgi:hypothetical protein